MYPPVADNQAAATGGMLAVDRNDDPVVGTSQDLVGPLMVELPIGHGLLDALGGRGNQLGYQVFGPVIGQVAPWQRTSPSS